MSNEKSCQVNKVDADYLCEVIGNVLLSGGKGQLLNIVEACGMPSTQEQAVKRMAVDWLHQTQCTLIGIVNNIRVDQSQKVYPIIEPQ
jgi:hypothetical protein